MVLPLAAPLALMRVRGYYLQNLYAYLQRPRLGTMMNTAWFRVWGDFWVTR